MAEKQSNFINCLKICFLGMCILILACFLIGELKMPCDREKIDDSLCVYKGPWEWVHEDGSREYITIPNKLDVEKNEEIVLESVFADDVKDNTYLAFSAKHQKVKVYIGKDLRYQYDSTGNWYMGYNSASRYVFVPLSIADKYKRIRIELVSDSRFSGLINEVYQGDKFGIWYYVAEKYGISTIISLIFMIIAVNAIIICRIIRHRMLSKISLEYLGWSILFIALWIFGQSGFRQLIFRSSAMVELVAPLLLYLIPIAIMLYIDNLQEGRHSKYLTVMISATVVAIILSVSLHFDGKIDLVDSLAYNFMLMLIDIAVISYTLYLDHKNHTIRTYASVAIALSFFFICCVAEMISSYVFFSIMNGMFMCAGLLVLFIAAALKTADDVIEKEHEKQQAVLDVEAKEQFLANMSHELRTPINSMLGMNEMILRENRDSQITEYAQTVSRAGKMLLGLVNDILDFSKIESGKMDLIMNNYELAPMLLDLYTMTEEKAKAKELDLIVDVDENLPSILEGDEIRIKQIIVNILSNAVKYTSNGHVAMHVSGETKDDGFMLCISVEDTGQGIKEEDIDKLFESFTRLEEKSNRAIEGTGLGLAITKMLVDQMGGNINVLSQFGSGSIFVVTIPQKVVDAKPLGDWKEHLKNDIKSGEHYRVDMIAPDAHVLVVDDNDMNLQVVKGLLKGHDMHLDLVTSGHDAVEACKRQKYDIIFMDHMMPEMDGIECFHILQHLWKGENETPVIALTANAISGMREMYLGEGFTDYLSKPIDVKQLERMLVKYIAKDKQLEALDEIYLIDMTTGLTYSAGDEEMYNDFLSMYVNQGKENLENLSNAFYEQDWKQYGIIAHAVKSTSKTIGAMNFAELALEHEKAGKDADVEFILTHWTDFEEIYSKLVEKVADILKAKES